MKRSKIWTSLKGTAAIMALAGTTGLTAHAMTLQPTLADPSLHLKLIASAPHGLIQPDDLTLMHGHLFVSYQNNIQGDGTFNKGGKNWSAVVEYSTSGKMLGQWHIVGHCDGLQADPAHNRLIATVNEDNNSSLYIIRPSASTAQQVQHLQYDVSPAKLNAPSPKFPAGGSDGIAIQNGHYYISGSSPAPDNHGVFDKTALFGATISGKKVALSTALRANATAMNETTGVPMKMNISDPDSSFVVPKSARLFGGDVGLVSQNDADVIFIHNIGTAHQSQNIVPVGTNINDLAWATRSQGTLYMTDSPTGKIYAVSGKFTPGTVFVTSPGDAGVAAFLGTVDLKTGIVTPMGVGFGSPEGLIFVAK